MDQLAIFSDSTTAADDLHRHLSDTFRIQVHDLNEIRKRLPERYTIVDVNLKDASRVLAIKQWLERKPKDSKAIFVVDKASHVDVTRAYAIGAAHVLQRPLDKQKLLASLLGEFAALSQTSPEFLEKSGPGVNAGLSCLQETFQSICTGEGLDSKAIETAGEKIVSQIGSQGLAEWVETVRKHHSQTYQHCLLVTGVAVAFAKHLGFAQKDQMRLSLAGMMHDIGKAKIPIAILEKPGPLNQAELAVMRQHPELGAESLAGLSDVSPDMVEIVLHHHEYLDGSGYPHGLKDGQINDFVRLMTVSDIFGALIERRSYKPPMSGDAAYKILRDMGPKLDVDMVREFGAVTHIDRFG